MAQVSVNLLINGLSPVQVGGTNGAPALKIFPNVPGPSIGVASTKPGVLNVPGAGAANGQRMSFRASGSFQVGPGGACPSVTIGLYAYTYVQGSTNGTLVATPIYTTGAITTQSNLNTAYPFAVLADMAGDTGSGLVQLLSASSVVDGTAGTTGTPGLISGLTSINFNNSIPFGVGLGITFGVSEPLNLANLYQFDCSL